MAMVFATIMATALIMAVFTVMALLPLTSP
ncbi:MAG: hypothetical protein JWQ21_1254 [Herminiimonas sp.]|nr:hypothetical protein [Herminiimonas sp.]